MLEVVHVAEHVEQARNLAELHRVVAREVHAAVPGHVGERVLEVAGELVDLPAQVEVLEQRLRQPLQLGTLLGGHRVQQLLHLRHRLRHLLEQLVEGLRVAGEEVAVLVHEALEVGLFATLALLEHLVEVGEHVLHALHLLGRHVLHAFGHLVEVALEQLLAQLVHQLLEPLAGCVVHEVVVLERLHPAGEIGRKLVELLPPLLGEILDDLLPATVARLPCFVDAPVDPGTLLLGDLPELLGDVVVDAAEVPPLELLPPALPKPLEHVAQPHQLLVVAVAKPLLHQPPESGVQVAVVEEIVGHLLEERVGVEIEAGLGAVPARILESLGLAPPEPHRTHPMVAVASSGSATTVGKAAVVARYPHIRTAGGVELLA